MSLETQQIPGRVLLRGTCREVQGHAHQASSDLGQLVNGLMLALHGSGIGALDLDLDSPFTQCIDARPVELIFDDNGAEPHRIRVRFLDVEGGLAHG